jgi:hypothetical protein
MHILESLALSAGAKIDRPDIYEKFIPLPFDENKLKYIVLTPYSSINSKNYELWNEVVAILSPALNKEKIRIVQAGKGNQPKIAGVSYVSGSTDANQLAYLIKRSELYVGPDELGMHIASALGKKIVALFGPYMPSHTGPYWSDEKDVKILNETKEGVPISYSPAEKNKRVNLINPESIAQAVCDSLGIELSYDYKTIFIGTDYPFSRLELIPYSYINNIHELGVDSIIVRMDLEHSESVLEKQLSMSPCSVVLDKEVNTDILTKYASNISEIIYFVDENTDTGYLQKLKDQGIKFNITSRLTGKDLNKIKLRYLDFVQIIEIPFGLRKSVEKLINGKEDKIFYKNSSLTVNRTSLYTSKCHDTKLNPPLRTLDDRLTPRPIIDNDEFWKELNSMILLEKAS